MGKPGKGLGMGGGRQTTLFASFARAGGTAKDDSTAPPRTSTSASSMQPTLDFALVSGDRQRQASSNVGQVRPEKKKVLRQGRLGQTTGTTKTSAGSVAGASVGDTGDCIILEDDFALGAGGGKARRRPAGGLLEEQERNRKRDLEQLMRFKVAAVEQKHEKLSQQEKMQRAEENLRSVFALSSFRALQVPRTISSPRRLAGPACLQRDTVSARH
jgi:hypothetical protein